MYLAKSQSMKSRSIAHVWSVELFISKTPNEKNIFSCFDAVNDDAVFMKNLGGHIFIPRAYVNLETELCDPTDIEFEIVNYPDSIYDYPYAKELLEDKRVTDDKEAWRLVDNFFKDKKEKQIEMIQIDNDGLLD